MIARFVILTGASGAGKTTIARHFLNHYQTECVVFFFDTIGVPAADVMERDYGGAPAWQRAKTLEWIARIRPYLSAGRPVLFEGQMKLAFIKEAVAAHRIPAAHVVLLDCDDLTRMARLQGDRAQPHLANPAMMNWARSLREEAVELADETLDTTHKSLAQCIAHIKPRLFGETGM